MIIGLSGYARSGKDEAAKVLVEQHGFIRIAFADKLREFLYALNPIVHASIEWPDQYNNNYWLHTVRLRDVIDRYGWDGYKETPYVTEIRQLLQKLGTEAGRQVLWDSIWIDAAFHGVHDGNDYVVTDARFPNEADAIIERGGYVLRISRAGVGPANDHPSETSLDTFNFDGHINNSGDLEEYHQKVNEAYQAIKDGRLLGIGRRLLREAMFSIDEGPVGK